MFPFLFQSGERKSTGSPPQRPPPPKTASPPTTKTLPHNLGDTEAPLILLSPSPKSKGSTTASRDLFDFDLESFDPLNNPAAALPRSTSAEFNSAGKPAGKWNLLSYLDRSLYVVLLYHRYQHFSIGW